MISRRYARLSQVRLHYLEVGKGDDVVMLLHTPHSWRHIVLQLQNRHRVLAPDMRGLGDSSCPTSGYDVKTIANDVIELLDSLGIEKVSVVGHDWGGPVAFARTSKQGGLGIGQNLPDRAAHSTPVPITLYSIDL
jgi:pimeloyl-ACP methyl ester carboxylesterase